MVSDELKIIRGNPAAEEMFRQSHDLFEGKPLADFFPDQPQILDKVRQTLTTGSSFHDVECWSYRKSHETTFPTRLTLSPYMTPSGHIQGVTLLVKDMTLLKELEETSRHSEHMSTLGVMALGMAHEIKNPLGGIRGSAQLLRDELADPEFKEYLEIIVKEVDRINLMVEHMLDFARPKKLKLKKTNIHKILRDIIVLEKKALAAKKCEFIQDYDPSLPLIQADADQLKQVFLNLIKNAIEASPQSKNIRLVTRISSQYSIKPVLDRCSRMNILVEIIDCGPGIAEAEQKKIFTPFYTTKNKGSGLGLPISLKIIEDHWGKIKILSDGHAGTTAQVFLPVQQRE